MVSTRHVVLIGLMASGKSTVGTLLAARLGRPFVDNDTALEERTGRSAREIAAADGADVLHAQEAEVLVSALADPVPAVVAAAASAPTSPGVVSALQDHDVVYLRATPDVLAARLARAPAGDGHRPFVAENAREVLAAQFAARDDRYRALATVVVDADESVDGDERGSAIVDEISSALARGSSRTRPGS